jgi:polyisoprenoid-binding protein YceI
MRDGALAAAELSAGDRVEIERVIRSRILATDKYPRARLEARVKRVGSSAELDGELELVGQRRRVTFQAERAAQAPHEWQARVDLVPSRWGIRPYTALLGAIRLADRIQVVARLQALG